MKPTYILTRHTRPLASGLYQVRLKKTVNRKPQYKDTGILIRLDQWNKKKREITNHQEAGKLNHTAKKMLWDWERNDLGFAKGIDDVDGSDQNVLNFLAARIRSYRSQGKFSTAKRYNTLYNHLKSCFGKQFFFHQVNHKNVQKFLDFLYEEVKRKNVTKPSTEGVRNYFLTFKALTRYARKRQLIAGDDPFDIIDPPKKMKPSPKSLWVDELHKVISVQINDSFLNKWLFDAINVFNLQFWANGSRISDALQLRWSDITPDGIQITQEKTDSDQAIGLSANVVSILRWYVDPYQNTWDWEAKQFRWEQDDFKYPDHADTLWHLDMEYFKQLRTIQMVKDEILYQNPRWETSGLTEHQIRMKVQAEIPDYLISEFQEIKEARYKEILRHIFDFIQKSDRRNDYVFPFMKGVDQDPEAIFKKRGSATALVNRRLKKAAVLLGVRDFSSHAARHSLASICVKRKVHIYTIKGLFNHSSVRITENYIDSFPQVNSEEVYQEVQTALGSL